MILDDTLDWGSLCKYFLKASLLGTAAFNLIETGWSSQEDDQWWFCRSFNETSETLALVVKDK
jgi:hypothetical protein